MTLARVAAVVALCAGAPAWGAFETLGQTSRAGAMGGAVVAAAEGVPALWYNPAGLAGPGSQVMLDYAQLYAGLDAGPDVQEWTAGYVHPLAGGRLGIGLAGLAGGFYSETGAALGYGRQVGTRLRAGVDLRLLRWSADGYRDPGTGLADADWSGSGLALGGGLGWSVGYLGEGRFGLGVSARNLNEPDVSHGGGTGLPRHLTAGVSYDAPALGLELDVERVDGRNRVRAGGEYRVRAPVDLRLRGGMTGTAGEGVGGDVTGGVGLRLGRLQVDYAYSYSPQIATEGQQRLSLQYSF